MAFLPALAALLGQVAFADLGALGGVLAWSAGSLARIRRGHVEAAMARAGVADVGASAAAMYASLATGVMELLWLSGRPHAEGSARALDALVTVDPRSRPGLDEALASGRGAVFAASHTGNWELAACAMAARMPLSVLVKRVSVGAFARFMARLRTRYGVGQLEGEGALARARRELDAGRVVAVLLDQVPARDVHGDWLPFLGAPALTDRAAAALAASAGVPLLVTASRRDPDGRHVLHVLSVKHPPARGRRAWAQHATREATRELEAFVREYPDQWLWLHRRWRIPSP